MIDADGDAEMSVAPPCSLENLDFDKVKTVDLGWNRDVYQEFLVQHAFEAHPDDRFNEVDGDRIKAMVQDIIRVRGRGHILCHELENKMARLKESGDNSVSSFFIHLSDKHLPRRKLSTKKLSTPEVRNAVCSALFGSTSETVYELLSEHGMKALFRRALVGYVPNWNMNPFQKRALREKVGPPNEELERWRLKALWNFLFREQTGDDASELSESSSEESAAAAPNPAAEEKQNEQQNGGGGGAHFLKEEVPYIAVGKMTPIFEFQMQYVSENPDDSALDNIIYPPSLVDEDGQFRSDVYTAHDFYRDIVMEKWRVRANGEADSVQLVLLNDLHMRVFRLGFTLTARKKMLDIVFVGAPMRWEPFEIDVLCLRDARQIVTMADTYARLQNSVPRKNLTPAKGARVNQAVTVEEKRHKARCVLLGHLIRLCQPDSDSGKILKSFQTPGFKKFARAPELTFIVDKLTEFGVVLKGKEGDEAAQADDAKEEADKENAAPKAVKRLPNSCKYTVTRVQLSTIGMNKQRLDELTAFLDQYSQTVAAWANYWGSAEVKALSRIGK